MSGGDRRFFLRLLGLGVFLAVGLALLLAVPGGLPWPDAVLCAVLFALMPALALAQVPLAEVDGLERIPAYAASAITIAALAALCWAVGTRSSGPRTLGFVALSSGAFALWTLALAGVGLAVLFGFHGAGKAMGWSESPLLRALLPRTPRERAAFVVLSLAAGTGEEIVYRGYSIPVLAVLLGPLGAAVLTSAVFGVLHAYQGSLGMVRTAVLGGVLAWGFLASGSLWPAIAAHAVIDVVAGTLLADRLTAR